MGIARRRTRRPVGAWSAALLLWVSGAAALQAHGGQEPDPRSGPDLYLAACAACHGADGRGLPQAVVGFETPLPDFSDCSFATPEPDADWIAVVHQGGPVRAFDPMMPAFGEALVESDLARILGHIRGFCTNRAWPPGELNLPRALVTEKAFPENEAVLTTVISDGGERAVGTEWLYERRLGARSQVEVAVPLELQRNPSGGWRSGLGDVAVAVKRALFHSLDTGSILSAAAEVVFPTGREEEGLGRGVTIFEPFAAFGQMLPSDGFLQLQVGLELPADGGRAAKEAFWRAAIGKSFFQGRFGRSWSPMIELLGARALGGEAETSWDIVPQVQVTLSKRQHVMLSGGARIPVTETTRSTQVIAYLLWDWFDGGLFDGWR